ncbi:mediator of RNA polymerase II transcription subunit 23-like [Homalodisca vitripennis]|uniref:mediator of RNA polymerase II transcription subunit 23-like n=1 Tax=Homalodisca vitripennis TaxID=197043 RepID=UPI001EEBFCEF|nr:mediator of RNA polymerase II transcription subunit 23-like [Homalodisca vitripennis]
MVLYQPGWCVRVCCAMRSYNTKKLIFGLKVFISLGKIIGGVDYKGVREIMKGCCEKAQTLPSQLNGSAMPQMKALEVVLEYIFDRNACLLPGYFIANEIQKAYPEGKNWPHWKLANLLSSFVDGFRVHSTDGYNHRTLVHAACGGALGLC